MSFHLQLAVREVENGAVHSLLVSGCIDFWNRNSEIHERLSQSAGGEGDTFVLSQSRDHSRQISDNRLAWGGERVLRRM